MHFPAFLTSQSTSHRLVHHDVSFSALYRGQLSQVLGAAHIGGNSLRAIPPQAVVRLCLNFVPVPPPSRAPLLYGHICNAQEIRELYGLPPLDMQAAQQRQQLEHEGHAADSVPPPSPNIEGAQLILELYGRRFEDKDGDPSDQPATALTACEGSFSFVLLDSERWGEIFF